MVDGFSCILIKGIHQLNPQNLSSTTTNSPPPKKKKKKKKAGKPSPIKTIYKKFIFKLYRNWKKKGTALGQYLFCVICNWAVWNFDLCYLISSHLSPLTLEVIGAPQMTLQQYLSILPCLPLPSGNLQTPFPSIPWYYLPISSSVFLSFLLLSLSLAELSSPCQRILRCGHTELLFLPLSSSPSCSFHCPLQNCLRHARGSWDVAIPSYCFFTMVRKSSCIPTAFWILLRTSSFVTRSL